MFLFAADETFSVLQLCAVELNERREKKKRSTEKTKVSTFAREPAALGLNRPVAKFSLVSFPLFYVVFFFFLFLKLSRHLSRRPFPRHNNPGSAPPRDYETKVFRRRRRHRTRAVTDALYVQSVTGGSGGSGVCNARRRVLNLFQPPDRSNPDDISPGLESRAIIFNLKRA